MSTQMIEAHRKNAEIYTGADICKQKSIQLLEEFHLPNGLLPLDQFIEVGYNRQTGFVWLKQKKSHNHVFKKIGRQVWYDTEVTAFIEERQMKKMTGVKSKELLIWVTLCNMYIDDPASGKVTIKTSTGLSRTFPVSAFELEKNFNILISPEGKQNQIAGREAKSDRRRKQNYVLPEASHVRRR